MGLAETQKVLARLYTSASLRERFAADPVRVGKEFGLSEIEAQQLSKTCATSLEFFADTLLSKRLREVVKMLPLTHAALQENFGRRFKQYAAETPISTESKKHAEDALAFTQYLQNSRQDFQDWQIEVIRYEEAWLLALKARAGCRVRFFRFQVNRLISETELPPVARRFVSVWLRFSSQSVLRHYVLPLPSFGKKKKL